MTINQTIKGLFDTAKGKNEFEFVCTLINYKGLGSFAHVSNLHEWFNAIDFYKTLYSKETDKHKKLRIGLLLYSTFFESSDLYAILGNLARIILGWRAAPYLYWKHPKADRWYGTGEKVSLVSEILTDCGFQPIEQFFINAHHKELRNTFFHSAYSLENDEYQLHDSEPIFINQSGTTLLNIQDFIFPKVDQVIMFFDSFKNEYFSAYSSYKTNKKVIGAMPEKMEIEIIGSESGLTGFVAGGSYIKLENDFWMGMNIVFDFPSEVDRFIGDELKRLNAKDTIRNDDGTLQHLNDVITERNRKLEIQDLATVYQRFGDIKFKQAVDEQNKFKQLDLYRRTLSFYQKMLNLDKSKDITSQIACSKYFVSVGDSNLELKRESLNDFIKCIEINPMASVIKNSIIVIKELKQQNIEIAQEKGKIKSLLNKITNSELIELINEKKKELEGI